MTHSASPLRQVVDNTFERLNEDLQAVLKALLEEDDAPGDTRITRQARTLYRACMDTGELMGVLEGVLRDHFKGRRLKRRRSRRLKVRLSRRFSINHP